MTAHTFPIPVQVPGLDVTLAGAGSAQDHETKEGVIILLLALKFVPPGMDPLLPPLALDRKDAEELIRTVRNCLDFETQNHANQ